MARIRLTPHISIDEDELVESFVLASGPGGQNVNKVATAVELRFDMAHSPSLPDLVRERLIRFAGRRLTKDGVLVIQANRFRSQERNREDGRERLAALVARAADIPKPRRPTRPTRASKERRLEGKKKRGRIKQGRSKSIED
jgi:ribosome-associated protein